MRVKDNQPHRLDAIQFWFDRPVRYPDQDERFVEQVSKGHGRRGRYRLWATTALNAYLDWPEVQQGFHLERYEYPTRPDKEPHVRQHYGITSLSPQQAEPGTLLAWWRQHGQWKACTGSAMPCLPKMRAVSIPAMPLKPSLPFAIGDSCVACVWTPSHQGSTRFLRIASRPRPGLRWRSIKTTQP
jgi:hypothetical protein